MTKISESGFKLIDMELEDYLKYCEKHKLKAYLTNNKRLFCKLVIDKKLYKNCDGELIEYEETKL